MQEGGTPDGQFSIEYFQIDAGNNSIYHQHQVLHVEPRAMHVLWVLAEHAGQTVEREVLFSRVWGQQVVVEEALTRTISQLRKALNDSHSRKLIQTVPKKGYRLAAEVNWHNAQAKELTAGRVEHQSLPQRGASPAKNPIARKPLWLVMLLVGLVLLIFNLNRFTQPTVEHNSSVPAKAAISVLPLSNQSGNPQHDYLANGIAEEILTSLTQTPGLEVVSRYSAFSYGNTDLAPREIAEKLEVRYVLVGKLQRIDEQGYQIQVELLDSRNEADVWRRTYAGPQDQLSKVSHQISSEVRDYLVPQESVTGNNQWTAARIDTEAYQHYLQGQYWWMNGSTSEWFYRAEKAFLDAIQIAPEFAAAHGSLAYIYARYQFHDIYMNKEDAIGKARQAINTAMALDPEQVDALHAQAILATLEHRFGDADNALQRALAVRSPNAQAWYLYSELALAQNQPDQALSYALRAREADPLSPWVNINLAMVYYYLGQYEQALKAISVAQNVDPEYSWSYVWQARILHKTGRLAEAILAMQQCLSLDPGSAANSAYLGLLYLELDLQPEAANWFERTASLYGDSVDARFWKNFIRLAYQNQEPQITLSMLQSMQSTHTGTYNLYPLMRHLYLALDQSKQGAASLAQMQPSLLEPDGVVNIRNSELALTLLALSDDKKTNKELNQQLWELHSRFPQWALYSGLRANHLLIQGQPEQALKVLLQVYQKGWIPLWWVFSQADQGDNTRALKALPAFSKLSALIGTKQQQQRQKLDQRD
jgi:DNA-binding winged helix-turn-helix (wHTH) protein/TolB-like protein/Tfp pilus assembly protein PilF